MCPIQCSHRLIGTGLEAAPFATALVPTDEDQALVRCSMAVVAPVKPMMGVPCCQLWKVSKYPRNQAKWLINAHRSWSIVHLELKLERVLCVSCGTLRVCLFFDTGAQKRSILYGLVVWLSQNFKIPNQRVDIGWHGWTDHANSDFCCFPFSWLNFCIWLRLLHIVGLNFSVIWMGVQCALTMGNCRYRPVASSTPALLMFWRPPMWPERTGGSCAGGRMWGGVVLTKEWNCGTSYRKHQETMFLSHWRIRAFWILHLKSQFDPTLASFAVTPSFECTEAFQRSCEHVPVEIDQDCWPWLTQKCP